MSKEKGVTNDKSDGRNIRSQRHVPTDQAQDLKYTSPTHVCFPNSYFASSLSSVMSMFAVRLRIRGCIRKFLDWPPGANTANDRALSH
jgi:hypothetical protein